VSLLVVNDPAGGGSRQRMTKASTDTFHQYFSYYFIVRKTPVV
jgi:hypothetical protein